jgi:hypothetical protein
VRLDNSHTLRLTYGSLSHGCAEHDYQPVSLSLVVRKAIPGHTVDRVTKEHSKTPQVNGQLAQFEHSYIFGQTCLSSTTKKLQWSSGLRHCRLKTRLWLAVYTLSLYPNMYYISLLVSIFYPQTVTLVRIQPRATGFCRSTPTWP